MIIDRDNTMAWQQAVTSATTNASTDYIDLGAARDIAKGETLWFYAVVTTTATSGGSATLTVALVTDDNTSFSSATTLWTSSAIAVASLTAGTVLAKVRVPSTTERYLRTNWVVATAALTAGNFSAFLATDVPDEGSAPTKPFYPTSYTQG